MDFETIPRKQLNDLEIRVRELLVALRRAKLQDDPAMDALMVLEKKLGDARRKRYEEENSEYQGY